MRITCTEKDFKSFRDHASRHLNNLRLGDWDVAFDMDRKTKVSDELAHVAYIGNSKEAEITLMKNWGIKVSDRAMDEIALHAVLHILLAPITDIAEDEVCHDGAEIRRAEHEIIRRLLLMLFRPRKKSF